MNRIHQIIWNKNLGVWIVASELAKRGKKLGSSRRNALILPLLLHASMGFALPTGNELVAGSVNVSTPSAGQMHINQSSQKAIVNWQGFSIGSSESVNIQQPNASAALLNRVVGQDASSIQGKLNANGQVYLVNPNGVLFSKTAQVDVGGLVAGTHAITNQDFLDGKQHFTQNNATGSVINQGHIKTPEGGVVALIGEQVENTGSISTPQGTTALAAGKTIDLDMQGNGLVEVKITEAALKAQINNSGIIQADGGQVIMTAKAAGQLLNTVINNAGIVEARGLIEKNGKIVLSGGDSGLVQVSGTLDASGVDSNNTAQSASSNTQGGNISVSGEQIHINDSANLNASGNAGGGTIVIGDKQTTSQTTINSGAVITNQALDHGKAGTIEVLANMNNGTVKVDGKLDASAPKLGDGGFIDTSAAHVQIADTAKITTKAGNGKTGTWLIDPTDFNIAASGGNITGAALSTSLSSANVAIASTAGNSGVDGDVNVNDVVSWSVNKLTLNAQRNININANLNGSGTAQLALAYGQASAGGGTNDNYFINNNAQVFLPAGANFTTQKGSTGAVTPWTVITSLGAEGSITAADLQGMNGNLNKNYVLGADIDASATNTWNSGAGFAPVGSLATGFSGNFDGLGHAITGLTINLPTTDAVGLFGQTIVPNTTISNLGLIGGTVVGRNWVGGLVGVSGKIDTNGIGSIINNVYNTGNVTGLGTNGSSPILGIDGEIGGLVGRSHGPISNSYSTGNVNGNIAVGGLVGFNFIGTVSNAYATGNVAGILSGNAQIGGLVGWNNTTVSNSYATGNVSGNTLVGGLVGQSNNTITDSYATGNVTGTGTGVGGLVGGNNGNATNVYALGNIVGFDHVGGLIGQNAGTIVNAYTTGSVTGTDAGEGLDSVGGLVGLNNGNISDSHAQGPATGTIDVGGLVGFNQSGNISNSYAVGNVSGLNSVGGLVGRNDGTINNSHATGSVTSIVVNSFDLVLPRSVGGLVGLNNGSIGNSYASGSTTGYVNVGGLAGENIGLIGDNSYAIGIVTGLDFHIPGEEVTNIGGLVGGNSGTINNAYAMGNVTGIGSVGGLLGTNGPNGIISNVFATGNVNGNIDVGGLVGRNYQVVGLNSNGYVGGGGYGAISNAYATGNVTGDLGVGGLVGQNSGIINNTYATGNVNGNIDVGGLVGLELLVNNSLIINGNTQNSSISNSYATGNVTGTNNVGGLVGRNDTGIANLVVQSSNISNAFWDTQSTGQNNGVGSGPITGATGKTSAEMKQLTTFIGADWSINGSGGSEAVWRIYEGNTTPLLLSFLSPLTVTADNISKTYNGVSDSTLSNASYSIAGAATSGHLFNTANPYNGAINAGITAYAPTGLYSDQQGYDISLVNGNLTINPATLTASIIGNPTKIYDGNTAATLTAANYNLSGFFGSQGANVTKTVGTYNSADVGLANTVTANLAATDFTANAGTLLSNYTLPISASGAGHITPVILNLTATITGNPTKTYDGTKTARLTPTDYKLTGFNGSDGASITQTIGTYNSADVKLANTVIATLAPADFSANGGTKLSNYTLPVTASGAGAITPATLTIIANADSKFNDGKAYTGGNGVTYTGFVNNETSSVLSGSLSYGGNSQGTINAGTYDITPGGLSAGNYAITYINGQLSIIPPVTINPGVPRGYVDNTVSQVKSVTYQPPMIATQYEPPSSSVVAVSAVKDNTEVFTGVLPGSSSQYCGSSGSAAQMANCLNPLESEHVILPTLTVKNSAGRVKRLQMSANHQFLSLLLEDGSVRIWDFQQGDQHQIVTSDKTQAFTDISPVDNTGELVSIASKAGIDTQDIIIPTPDNKLTINEPDIRQFMTSNDGSLLLVSAGTDQLSLWNSKQHEKLWQLPYDRGVVNGLALSDNKQYGAVLSRQPGSYVLLPTDLKLKSLIDAVNIIDLGTGKIIKSLPNVGEQILSMQFIDNDTLQLKLSSGEMLNWSIASNSPKTAANFAENVTAVDTESKSYAYVLEDGTVRIRNDQGDVLLSIKNKDNPFKNAILLDGDKKLLTVMDNGELSLWDVATSKKLLRLFSTQQGWTVMDPYGRFDGSEDAMENFSWLASEEDIPLDSFSENYYEPGLLSSVLQNQDLLNSNPNMVKSGITLPPKVSLQIAEQQAKVDSITLQLDVFDRGGGINKINVYQNGKILNSDNAVVAQQTLQDNGSEHRELTLNITPSAGKNTVKVIASNGMGIESSSGELSFDGKTKAYASSVRLLTIGIDNYSDAKLNLDYSVKDADAIGEAIKSSSKIVASKNLYNENATKPKILAELKELSQGVQQDVLVIYFAGHGLALGKEWYFLPYETQMQPSLEKIAATGITATELSDIFKNSKIQHILLMVDSCYSGAGLDAFSKLQNGQRYFTRQLSRSLGITVMTAAAKDQKSFELKSLGHGLFTYLVTQELQGKDATQPVTAHGIADNIAKTLPVFSKKMLGTSQEPAVYTKGNNFMLTNLLKEPNKDNASDSKIPAIVPPKSAQ